MVGKWKVGPTSMHDDALAKLSNEARERIAAREAELVYEFKPDGTFSVGGTSFSLPESAKWKMEGSRIVFDPSGPGTYTLNADGSRIHIAPAPGAMGPEMDMVRVK